jgi:hypothetical protein
LARLEKAQTGKTASLVQPSNVKCQPLTGGSRPELTHGRSVSGMEERNSMCGVVTNEAFWKIANAVQRRSL